MNDRTQAMIFRILGILWATGLLGLWAESPRPARSSLQIAREATKELLDSLKTHLVQELQAGGPAKAIEVCSSLGQKIPQTLMSRYGILIKRTSLKVRNPRNAPTPDEKALLQTLETLAKKDSAPDEWVDTVTLQGKPVFRYAKPLYVQGLCLVCHGPTETLSPEVRKILDEKYPQDRARGYQVGDFRGMVIVKIPLQEQGGEP